MSRFWPSPAEAEMLRFVLRFKSLRTRFLVAGAFFAAGLAVWCLLPSPFFALPGLALALVGHLPLWVRGQSTAPGGATPVHEEIWAPTEDDWLERVTELESRGERWDASPWDVTSGRGCLLLLGILVLAAGAVIALGVVAGVDPAVRLAGAVGVLLPPLWLNGMRTTWNPSELRKKGEALAVARAAAAELAEGEFDPVPLLALREGRRGKYPVDARLMLRPASDDGAGLLGVQVQVALNNVKGTDYPYLYCVVLGKEGFRLPVPDEGRWRRKVDTKVVFERGEGEGAVYLVVRQHADRRGGWHTRPRNVRDLVGVALHEGRRAREDNRTGGSG